MQYSTVKHVVFGIHDFSKAMGIAITPRNWTEELKFYLHDILFEARIAGKGVIGAVETLIGQATMPEEFVEPHDVRRWLDLHGDEESRVVYGHAIEEAAMGLSGKQVIHPSHIHPCKVAFTPSPSEIKTRIAILKAAIEADALLGGRIRFEGRDARSPDVRQGAADAAQGPRAARALRSRHRLRDRGAAQAAGAGGRENWPMASSLRLE
jgi:citrate lyase beta subunit